MTPLLGLTLKELEDVASQIGMPQFTSKQLSQWIYAKRVKNINEMTNISKRFREQLAERFVIGRSEPIEALCSVDGTVKYLFQTRESKFIETVYIPDGERATLCVSTQVGCKMNCLFCQTGKQGYSGNLSSTDILNQIYSVANPEKLTNIVFMGQGEPLDNYDNLMKSIQIITAGYGLAWSPKRITVSTVGIRKRFKDFLDESECHIAISLHSPFHALRLKLMPAEKQFAVSEIIETLRDYDFSHQRRLSFEYTMFKGINDDMSSAKELIRMLRGIECRINLIRFHKIPNVDLEGTGMEQMVAFRNYLTKHGIFTTIRTSRGEDIFAACGLLSTAKIMRNKEA